MVGYGRAEKQQVQEMMKLLLGLDAVPSPHDVADALAVAICHVHTSTSAVAASPTRGGPAARRALVARLPALTLRQCIDDRPPSAARFSRRPRAALIVDVGGVGYDVLVPLSTFYVLGEPGAAVTLRIHTHVREDVIALYGFVTRLEQDLFERLISINGIGPKLALAVLSGIEPAELIRAVRTQDVARLTRFPASARRPPSGSGSS